MTRNCGRCGARLTFEQIHTGFNDTGYLYCDRDGDLLVWSTFDPTYCGIVGDKHPWTLNTDEQQMVEAALRRCPCGGMFRFGNPPRCPECHEPLLDLVPDSIYFADFGQRLDPAASELWAADE